MAEKIAIDPITRIEGHLRIEAQVDGGKVTDAWSSSTMFRGLEIILQGARPARRLADGPTHLRCLNDGSRRQLRASCRRCSGDPDPRQRPQLIRNLIDGIQYVQDHVIHFYHLHALDWVDVTGALKADPAADGDAGAVDLRLAQVERRLFPGGEGQADRLREQRPTGPLCQRLLGPPGLQAAARGQPDGRGPLPGSAGLAARRHQGARHPGQQEPPSADLPGGRHGHSDRSEQRVGAQRQQAGADQAAL